MKPIHGAPKPHPLFDDGYAKLVPPVECGLAAGDSVTFTNDYGVKFRGKKILGFAPEITSWGGFVYLDNDAWWFPHNPNQLKKETA